MVSPYPRHRDTTATRPVRVLEFDADADAVQELCKEASAAGRADAIAVAAVTAQRLSSAPTRIYDPFAPAAAVGRSPTPVEEHTMPSTPYTVNDVMTKPVTAVTPATDFKEIVAAMAQWKVTAVPVIEGEGRVVGLVSEADLLPKEEFHERRPGLIEQLRRRGVIPVAARHARAVEGVVGVHCRLEGPASG